MASQREHYKKKVCDMCCHETNCWALGECNHPICLRCCAKLRILCGQRDCAVCRVILDEVLVVKQVKPFTSFATHNWNGDRKYGLYFQTPRIQDSYNHLKGNRCTKCTDNQVFFRTFKQLRDHMNKMHNLHYCDICVNNLMLFPSEFKIYTRQELTKHRRDGDPDDSAHKGHPLCQFCDERYLDNDALHSHLHKNHFWCHICEADGVQDFFPSYPTLRQHFKVEHYLCEEGACKQEQLTGVFRSKIDLQAHRASVHSKGLSKAEVKQIRQVDTGFTYGGGRDDSYEPPPRHRRAVAVSGGARGGGGGNDKIKVLREREVVELATALSSSTQSTKEPRAKKPLEKKQRKISPSENTKPPPGFNIKKDSSTTKPKEPTTKKDTLISSTLDRPPGFEPSLKSSYLDRPPGFEPLVVPPVSSVSETVTEWPDLTGSEPKEYSTELLPQPFNFTAHVSAPSLPFGNLSSETAFPALGEQSTSSSSFPSALDYGAMTFELKPTTPAPQTVPVTQQHELPNDIPALSHQAFPPIGVEYPPLTTTSTNPVSTSAISSNTSAKKKPVSPVILNIRKALGHDKEKFTQFKTLSGWYKSSDITIHEYGAQCSQLFGSSWSRIGPQLVELMPEQAKKKELASLFKNQPMNGYTRSQPPSVWVPPAAPKNKNTVSLSAQVPLSDKDYPTLSAAANQPSLQKNAPLNAWNLHIRS